MNKAQELKIRNMLAKDFYGVEAYPGDKDSWLGADIEQRENIDLVIKKLKRLLK